MNYDTPDNTPLDQHITTEGTAAGVAYASFGARVLAVIIDAIILGITGKVIAVLLGNYTGLAEGFGYLLGLTYNITLHYTRGATLGKEVLDLSVVSKDGGPISLQQAMYRECFHYFYIFTAFAVGYLAPSSVTYTDGGAFDFDFPSLTTAAIVSTIAGIVNLADVLWAVGHPQHQTLHDIVAETYCVKVRG